MKVTRELMEAAPGTFRVADTGELVERVRHALDRARLLGILSQTMVRDGDAGPMIVKMGTRPLSVKELSAEQMMAWADEVGMPWQEGYEKRVIQVWASDERVDRDGDIVEQSWRFDNYARNPLVLWGHEWGAPPIGSSIHWSVEERADDGDDYSGPALLLVELFAPGDVSPQADSVLRLAKAGFLRSGSVGFYPGKVVVPESDEAREELGIPEGGYLLQDNELIEHSHCSVPANPGALNILVAAKAAGGLRPTDVIAIRELARQDALIVGREDVWSRMDSAMRRMWRGLYPNVAIEDHKSVAHPVEPDSAVERSCAPAAKTVTLDEVADPEPTEPAGDEGGRTGPTLEELQMVIATTVDTLAVVIRDVDGLKSDVADLRSDLDGARREHEQDSSQALSALLSDLRENTGKALAKRAGGG